MEICSHLFAVKASVSTEWDGIKVNVSKFDEELFNQKGKHQENVGKGVARKSWVKRKGSIFHLRMRSNLVKWNVSLFRWKKSSFTIFSFHDTRKKNGLHERVSTATTRKEKNKGLRIDWKELFFLALESQVKEEKKILFRFSFMFVLVNARSTKYMIEGKNQKIERIRQVGRQRTLWWASSFKRTTDSRTFTRQAFKLK